MTVAQIFGTLQTCSLVMTATAMCIQFVNITFQTIQLRLAINSTQRRLLFAASLCSFMSQVITMCWCIQIVYQDDVNDVNTFDSESQEFLFEPNQRYLAVNIHFFFHPSLLLMMFATLQRYQRICSRYVSASVIKRIASINSFMCLATIISCTYLTLNGIPRAIFNTIILAFFAVSVVLVEIGCNMHMIYLALYDKARVDTEKIKRRRTWRTRLVAGFLLLLTIEGINLVLFILGETNLFRPYYKQVLCLAESFGGIAI